MAGSKRAVSLVARGFDVCACFLIDPLHEHNHVAGVLCRRMSVARALAGAALTAAGSPGQSSASAGCSSLRLPRRAHTLGLKS